MLLATITACVLMGPKVYQELFFHNTPMPPSKKGYASIQTEEQKASSG